MRRLIIALALLCLAAPGLALADAVSFDVTPPAIAIDALYNGENLTLTGAVPAGSQVVARLSGEAGTVGMKRKGKVFGLLWMNLDKVTFTNAPKVFLVAASPEAPAEAVARLGVPGLAERIAVAAKDADEASLVAEFLRFQKAEKLYKENAGEVVLSPDSGDSRPFTATLQAPSRLSPGAYSVEVFALRDGNVVAQGEATVQVAFTGAPAFLADMAFGHGALYGILASIVAILGGLAIGQLCSSCKGGAH